MVSRQFHKLKYAGSSPAPRTKNDTAKRQSEIKNQTHRAIDREDSQKVFSRFPHIRGGVILVRRVCLNHGCKEHGFGA